ncbi:hypothetical protein Tco_0186540 [Tanacetum coccineum]
MVLRILNVKNDHFRHTNDDEEILGPEKSGDIIVQQVHSSDNQADLFTKALPTTTFKKLVHGTGMRRLNELKNDIKVKRAKTSKIRLKLKLMRGNVIKRKDIKAGSARHKEKVHFAFTMEE